MSDVSGSLPPFDESELSQEDLAVLRAFEEMEDWDTPPTHPIIPAASPIWSGPAPSHSSQQGDPATSELPLASENTEEEMLLLFVSEIDEDIIRMNRALSQLIQESENEPTRFLPLRRAAHKIRGTAGAMECHAMAEIARHIETITDRITGGMTPESIGLNGLTLAVAAIEKTLESVVAEGQEGDLPLHEFEQACRGLQIDLEGASYISSDTVETMALDLAATSLTGELMALSLSTKPPTDIYSGISTSSPFVRIDARRIERLVHHATQLAEKRTGLESAQAQVNCALQDLHKAQARLQHLEPLLTSLLPPARSPYQSNEHVTSSLITRILNEARGEARAQYKARSRLRLIKAAGSSPWDELDMERYTEQDILIRSLREAIADVTITSGRVRAAFAHLQSILLEYTTQAFALRTDTLLLRLAPMSTLIPRLQRAIMMSAQAQKQEIQFEVVGDAIEVDQDILDALANPLLQLVRTCIADTFSSEDNRGQAVYKIWLHINEISNEINIEVGFSMTVHGGALAAVRESIQNLNGTISSQRNSAGGLSFYLRVPRSHGTVRCLLVRIGSEQVVVPFSQITRIEEGQQEQMGRLYHLGDLLGFSRDATPTRIVPTLILSQGISRTVVGVMVDEVVDEVDFAVKPLAPYLQRPGLGGSAVDGRGKAVLMVDLPELVRQYATQKRDTNPGVPASPVDCGTRKPRILIADDSVYLRQSLLQLLQHEQYIVTEARDGMEALEHLTENPPDVFLLDIEMPNLNGFDILSIMSLYPELANVKVVMLTSRSSEKHRKRAFELGAHVYLTKPSTQEILLGTIKALTS